MNKEIYELLKDKKRLKTEKLFIVDTERILKEIIDNDLSVQYFLYCEKGENIYKKFFSVLKGNAERVKESYINKFSVVESHQGFIAIVKSPDNELKDFKNIDKIVLLDNIQEPSNLGAIIRSGVAFDLENYLLINCAYIFNEKTIRASAGAVFLCKYKNIQENEIEKLKQKYQIIITASDSGLNLKKAIEKIKEKHVIVFGNEGKGISSIIKEKADLKIKIEHNKKIESLNVASASAIIFYELNFKI